MNQGAENDLKPLRELVMGIRVELPVLLGAAPLGMIYWVLATAAGLTVTGAQSMFAIVFAGSVQYIQN